jgi:hypothetical protein
MMFYGWTPGYYYIFWHDEHKVRHEKTGIYLKNGESYILREPVRKPFGIVLYNEST